MKQLSFKRRNVILGSEREPEPLKRNFNIGRYIYGGILLILAGVLVNFLINRFLFVWADGQMLFMKVDLRLTENARIAANYVSEGDSVRRGDTLFTYVRKKKVHSPGEAYLAVRTDTIGAAMDLSRNREQINWLDREVVSLRMKISGAEIEREGLASQLDLLKRRYPRMKEMVILEAITRGQFEAYVTDTLQLHTSIERLDDEKRSNQALLAEIQGRLDRLRMDYLFVTQRENSAMKAMLAEAYEDQEETKAFISPVTGTVNNIYLNEFETAGVNDNIMSIQHKDQILVKAYFEQAEMDELREGAVVDLIFPDKSTGKGFIKRFYSGTYTLPAEFQRKYESVKRTVAADIYPLNSEEAKKWKVFNMMSVKIRFSKL
jgi:multidrug resistance efflux pump